MQTITDNMVDRLHKKLVKLKLKHGADLDSWPNQITTTLFREKCYFAKLSLRRLCEKAWNGKIIWQHSAYRLSFRAAPGVIDRIASGPRVFNEYSRRCYNKRGTWGETQQISSTWNNRINGNLDIPSGVEINSQGFITDLLDASRIIIRAGLACSCVPDIYVKRGDVLALRDHMCQHDRYLIDAWRDRQVEHTLEALNEGGEFKKRIYGNRIQEINEIYATALEKLSERYGGSDDYPSV